MEFRLRATTPASSAMTPLTPPSAAPPADLLAVAQSKAVAPASGVSGFERGLSPPTPPAFNTSGDAICRRQYRCMFHGSMRGGLRELICGRQKLGHVRHSPHNSPQIPARGVSMRRGFMLKRSMFTATCTTICTCNTALMKELAVLAGAPVGARIDSHA